MARRLLRKTCRCLFSFLGYSVFSGFSLRSFESVKQQFLKFGMTAAGCRIDRSSCSVSVTEPVGGIQLINMFHLCSSQRANYITLHAAILNSLWTALTGRKIASLIIFNVKKLSSLKLAFGTTKSYEKKLPASNLLVFELSQCVTLVTARYNSVFVDAD